MPFSTCTDITYVLVVVMVMVMVMRAFWGH